MKEAVGMKRALAALLSLWTAMAILSGCASQGEEPKTMVYYTYFDTVSYIYSYAPDSQVEFEANCALVSDILEDIQKLQNNEEITEKTIIMDEKGFDATTITEDDVNKYGI